MTTRPISRRAVLRGLAGSVALPSLAAMQPRSAWAAGAVPTVAPRMMVAHFGTGMNLHEFFPKTTGADCELPQIVRPLENYRCLLYTSPSPRDRQKSRMPSSA